MAVNKSIVDWKTITSFVVDAFVGYGIPREDAEICADVLLESDKRDRIWLHGALPPRKNLPLDSTTRAPACQEFSRSMPVGHSKSFKITI